jgi:hypothetical protein
MSWRLGSAGGRDIGGALGGRQLAAAARIQIGVDYGPLKLLLGNHEAGASIAPAERVLGRVCAHCSTYVREELLLQVAPLCRIDCVSFVILAAI